MRPTFADPKTDLVFKRIFGDEAHKDLLIALLNALLELDEPHRIVDLQYLQPEQVPVISTLKNSIVDVKCLDATGTHYIVEMQLYPVEGFEKRVVYNVCKAYTKQLKTGEEYPTLNDVVAIAICNFILWPEPKPHTGEPTIPMLSRWTMREIHTGAKGLEQLRYAFLELPKYQAGDNPECLVDKWAYFFRETSHLSAVPKALAQAPFAAALEVARSSSFTVEEWDAYDRAKMIEQDNRGMITHAEKTSRQEGRAEGLEEGLEKGREEGLEKGREEGLEKGREEGLRTAIVDLCELLGIALGPEHTERLGQLDVAGLRALKETLKRDRQLPQQW
jgi:predicted transposase/invertase (TIGR01784 family)